jgi:hypothetical protein
VRRQPSSYSPPSEPEISLNKRVILKHFLTNLCANLLLTQICQLCREDFCRQVSCPATRHGGVWRERRYSFYSFLTSALDGGEWSASRFGRALPPGKGSPVPIGQEAGWAPEPVWTQRLSSNIILQHIGNLSVQSYRLY